MDRPERLYRAVWMGLVLAAVTFAGSGPKPADAQRTVRLETRVFADSVAIGERFTVSLLAEHGPETDVSFPPPDAGGALFGKLEVLDRSTSKNRQRRAGRRADSAAYEVTTFALDSVRVPPLPVQVTAGRDTMIRSAPARTVPVVSMVDPDAKGIHGVAPLASFPQPWWAWALLALVGGGLLAGLAYLWWRRRQGAETISARHRPDDDQTPYEAATSWIRQLESYDLSDPDAVKPFYVELSNALRVYLAHELGVAALERTTREVVATLEHRPDVPTVAANRVQAVLQLADLVKFADIRPSTDDHEKALREARAALDAIETAPREPDDLDSEGGDRRRNAAASSKPDAVDGVASAS